MDKKKKEELKEWLINLRYNQGAFKNATLEDKVIGLFRIIYQILDEQ